MSHWVNFKTDLAKLEIQKSPNDIDDGFDSFDSLSPFSDPFSIFKSFSNWCTGMNSDWLGLLSTAAVPL